MLLCSYGKRFSISTVTAGIASSLFQLRIPKLEPPTAGGRRDRAVPEVSTGKGGPEGEAPPRRPGVLTGGGQTPALPLRAQVSPVAGRGEKAAACEPGREAPPDRRGWCFGLGPAASRAERKRVCVLRATQPGVAA